MSVKNLWRFLFSKLPRGKEVTKVKTAQIESLRAAGKSYTFIANHLHRSNGYIQDFVTKRWSYGIKRQCSPKTLTQRKERQDSVFFNKIYQGN